jgi:hypothetical protein
LAPSRTNLSTVPRPRPEAPPVTMATKPFSILDPEASNLCTRCRWSQSYGCCIYNYNAGVAEAFIKVEEKYLCTKMHSTTRGFEIFYIARVVTHNRRIGVLGLGNDT